MFCLWRACHLAAISLVIAALGILHVLGRFNVELIEVVVLKVGHLCPLTFDGTRSRCGGGRWGYRQHAGGLVSISW